MTTEMVGMNAMKLLYEIDLDFVEAWKINKEAHGVVIEIHSWIILSKKDSCLKSTIMHTVSTFHFLQAMAGLFRALEF